MSAAPRRATFDDLEGVPENFVGEILDGELIVSPRPSPPHARAATAICSIVFDRCDGPFAGDVLARPDPFTAVEMDLRRWWS